MIYVSKKQSVLMFITLGLLQRGLKYIDTSEAEEMPLSHEPKQAYWQLLTESHDEWCDERASTQ